MEREGVRRRRRRLQGTPMRLRPAMVLQRALGLAQDRVQQQQQPLPMWTLTLLPQLQAVAAALQQLAVQAAVHHEGRRL